VYIPEYFRINDRTAALAFMEANPFAILVSASGGVPFATHIPVLADEREDHLVLIGHVARANPHWQMFEQEQESLVIFHGPHAYISPSLYESRESVPTWNYAAVHAYGRATVLRDAARLEEILVETIQTFDPPYLDQWFALRKEYRERMLGQIVGFEIVVTRMEAKFKLSQNRSKQDQASVMESLETSEDSWVSGIARLMKDQGLGL
jgi:transcriptional regulator